MYRLQQQIQAIEELEPYYFTFEYWRNGSLCDLGIETKLYSIKENKKIIKKYAIGYLDGRKLWVRPKNNTIAVMFWFNEYNFWTHLTCEEFYICFPELEEYIKNIKN